jgi:hypothetical protein
MQPETSVTQSNDTPSDRAFELLALGRVVWGVAAYLAPDANARVAGLPGRPSGETVYLTRVFGSRAFALGSGYLLSDARHRKVWQRLGLVVDVGDTMAGIVHLVRGDVPRRSAALLTLATGTYAAVGAAGVAKSLRARRPAR